jgi:4-amino-4-deoxy-L-arabinose transferase-like glycosyltransferase
MSPSIRFPWPVFLLIIVLSGFILGGLPVVPFHPDESTQLFMSADLKELLTNPKSLAFDPEKKDDLRQSYRLLDAPLTRYLLGAGLALSGQSPLQADWDWSHNWEDNRAAGALPDARQLLAGRIAVVLTIPVSLALIFLCGQYLGGFWSGTLAVMLVGLNALILLHSRRAMAEGVLLLGTCAFLVSLQVSDRRPWLAGLALGLAFNAKQSTLVLLPLGLLAVAWSGQGTWLPGRRITSGVLQYLLAFGLFTFLINPVYWHQPVQAAQAAIQVRRELLTRQVADVQRALPQNYLETPGERAVTLLAHLYLAPPMFAEAGNYQTDTAATEFEYLANLLNSFGRNLPGAGLFLGLSLVGLLSGVERARRAAPNLRRGLVLYLLATVSMIGGSILLIPLAWQRYVIPLVPLICLWASLGLVWLGGFVRQAGLQLADRLNEAPERS